MATQPTEGRRRRPRKNKAKDEGIKISLYINGIPYEYGKKCTFCEKLRAVFHCPDCKDFYCIACDKTTHSHGKRKGHVRSQLSLYSMNDASRRCTYLVRYSYLLRKIQRLTRLKFKRYFDKETLCHFYVNTVYNSTSWVKPRCLRHEELCPFMEPERAVTIMQGLLKMKRARDKQKWRTFLMRKFLKTLVRASYIERWDPIQLRYKYTNINTDETSDIKPKLLGSEKFDPNDVSLWNVDRVLIFIRRLGYRKYGYVETLKKYSIDGQLLLFFDVEDFSDIGIKNRVHIRRIKIELDKIYPESRREAISAIFKVKREKMRRFKQLEGAAVDIQRVYRGHTARTERRYLREIERITHQQQLQHERDTKVGVWWLQQAVPRVPSPLKDFGRKRDHYTVKGWGRWVENEWQGLNCVDEYLDSNITRKLTETLEKNGYDRRRVGELTGVLALKLKADKKPKDLVPATPPPPPPTR